MIAIRVIIPDDIENVLTDLGEDKRNLILAGCEHAAKEAVKDYLNNVANNATEGESK